jgi:hypothetical protein
LIFKMGATLRSCFAFLKFHVLRHMHPWGEQYVLADMVSKLMLRTPPTHALVHKVANLVVSSHACTRSRFSEFIEYASFGNKSRKIQV